MVIAHLKAGPWLGSIGNDSRLNRWEAGPLALAEHSSFCEFDGATRVAQSVVVTDAWPDRDFCLRPLPGGLTTKPKGSRIPGMRGLGIADCRPVGSRQKKKSTSGRLDLRRYRGLLWEGQSPISL